MKFLYGLWRRIIWFVLRRTLKAKPVEPAPSVEPVAPPPIETAPPTESATAIETATATESAPSIKPIPGPRLNRHERRVYERARRRHDRFVEPQGPQAVAHKSRIKTPSVERASTPVVDDEPKDPNDRFIVDEWLAGDNERVLYEESEFYGEFNFRDTILDQLDRYWVYLDRMRKHDPNAFGFYKQIGATLVPYAATSSWSDKPRIPAKITDVESYKRGIVLSPWFKQHWPAFGCCVYGANPRDEAVEVVRTSSGVYMMAPKFLYFRRVLKMPATVQPTRGGKLYTLTVWWDRVAEVGRHRYKWGRPQEFPIWISNDGKRIKVLKTRDDGGKVLPWWDWRIPHHYTDWSRQYGLDAQTHLTHIFCDAVHNIEHASYSVLRVEVSKGDLTAIFGLSPRRTGYFFQDRDIVLSESGTRKRVFHSVRPYVRADGVTVPMHFRGEREFNWAGYHVWISVPGRDHFIPLEFDVPSSYDRTKDGISEPEVGKFLKDMIHNQDTTKNV